MIFIGGIHGVGKTSFCKLLSDEFEIKHFSSSELISKEKQQVYNSSKKVKDFKNNQELLLLSLSRFQGENYLLDGHFCLINSNEKIVRIPEETFFKISPAAVIVLVDEPDSIAKRLFLRDKEKYDINFLMNFQNEEVIYAKTITSLLGIPFYTVNNQNPEEAKKCISSLFLAKSNTLKK